MDLKSLVTAAKVFHKAMQSEPPPPCIHTQLGTPACARDLALFPGHLPLCDL